MKKHYFTIIIVNRIFSISLISAFVFILSTTLILHFKVYHYLTKEYKKIFYVANPKINNTVGKKGKLAIIIDDFGEDRNGVQEMMTINRHLTFAVMPFLTYSKFDAETAHEKGYEVIVHLPMEANNAPLPWVGPKPILASMDDNKIKQVTQDAINNIPYAVGANIHMGSKASSDEHVMLSILDVIKEKRIYFVDSKTGEHSIVKKIADLKGVVCYDRDVFLDGNKSKSYIIAQLRKACSIALKNGTALAIGHVGVEGGKVTAEAINEMIPEFDKNNVSLVYVSELDK